MGGQGIVLDKVIDILRTSIEVLAIVLVAFLILELGSRIVHFGSRPAIMYITDEYGAPRMPGNLDMKIKLPGSELHRLCTDNLGVRMLECEPATSLDYKMLVIGDSQAFGWGMHVTSTLAAKLAEQYGYKPDEVGIVAVAAADTESLYAWAQKVQQTHNESIDTVLLYLNLGNDLDEMYFGRMVAKVQKYRSISQWLGVNSYFFLDFIIIKRAVFGEPWSVPPGTNPILFTLSDSERIRYADAVAQSGKDILDLWPDAARRAVLIIPNDYQVDTGEFDKYRKFYPSEVPFKQWQSKLNQAAELLNQYEFLVSTYLKKHGLISISASKTLAQYTSESSFDRASHHLTEKANNQVAQQVFKEIIPTVSGLQ